MDFQEMMNTAARIAKETSDQIIVAAEKEDIGALRSLSTQLQGAVDLLNVVRLCNKMADAAPGN